MSNRSPLAVFSRACVVVLLALTAFAAGSAQNEPVPSNYFGIHIQRGAPWPPIPFVGWRVPVAWVWLEPKPGTWDFTRTDEYVTLAAQHPGTELLFSLGYSPKWASSQPDRKTFSGDGACASPKNIQDWRNYVQTIGNRYKGQVHYFEIWNEPTVPFYWCGTVPEMVALTRVAREVLKGIDPTNQVLSPSAVNKEGFTWMNQFLQQGGNLVDIVAFHFYLAPGPPEGLVGQVQAIRAIMAKNGQANKPLWDTENTWNGPKMDPSIDPAYVARVLLLDRAFGVSRIYWYEWGNVTTALPLFQPDRATASPAGQAFTVVESWMIGTAVKSCTSADIPEAWHASHAAWTCELDRNGKLSRVVWNPDGDTTFTVPPSWTVNEVRDISGKSSPLPASRRITIGVKPLLLDQSR